MNETRAIALLRRLVLLPHETNAAIASRIIARTIKNELVKAKDPMSNSRKHTAYIPFWA